MVVRFQKCKEQNWEVIHDRKEHACMASGKETVKSMSIIVQQDATI